MVTNRKDNSPFVLALTILNTDASIAEGASKGDKVLVCVRNREVNKTHPDVVSVPTQRIPTVLAEQILHESQKVGNQGDTMLFNCEEVSNTKENGHNEILFLVESLLSKKLGIADPLEGGAIKFSATLYGNQTGVANYPNLDDSEHLRMLNIVVHVHEGADLFPENTKSYDLVKWVPVDGFLKMWFRGKDPKDIGLTGKQALGVCVDGLCISSSADILESRTVMYCL